MAKVTALSTVQHNGETYEAGESFDVADKKQIEALVAAGAVIEGRQKVQAPAEPEPAAE